MLSATDQQASDHFWIDLVCEFVSLGKVAEARRYAAAITDGQLREAYLNYVEDHWADGLNRPMTERA